ncbi:unnamed protein product [Paramecium sonneborni]|uniref:Uncharacterized protein n=1 Tax=Paramecium sonneborni TaxID=65129 RepID=A0A8S1LJB5_9CILI|nr:unnamed protein product [Paramecium sonneborni]
MINRLSSQSFKTNTQQYPIHSFIKFNRKRSCECLDCGLYNKKMLYVTTILPLFQPYHHIIIKQKEQKEKLQQRKRIKMSNKRHLIQKKTIIDIMQQQQYQQKKKSNRHHNTVFYNHKANNISNQSSLYSIEAVQTPTKHNQKSSIIFHRYNSFSPHKLFTDKKNLKLQTFSQRLKTFYLPITAPFESQLILRLQLVDDGKIKLIKKTGSQDDFIIKLRLNKFEEDDKKNEDQSTQNIVNFHILQQEDEEEDEQTEDENILNIKQVTISNTKKTYKNILKYNPRTLQSLVDKSQLGQSKIKDFMAPCSKYHKQNKTEQRITINNISPFINNISRCSPISSNKLLDEKRKKPKIKLLPLQNSNPFSKFNLTNISPTTQSRTKPYPKKAPVRNIFNAPLKKHQKNITFGQLLIKV